jgi:CBS domain-containing protein
LAAQKVFQFNDGAISENRMTNRKCLVPDVVSDQKLITLTPNASAREAAKLMNTNKVSSVLVVDPDGALCGIFTVRDIARRIVGDELDPDTTPLSDVMSENLKCASASDTPYKALRLMQDHRCRHLPITDDGSPNGRLLGIVSRRSFFPEEEALLGFEEHLWENMR